MGLILIGFSLSIMLLWLIFEFKNNGFTLVFMSLIWVMIIYCLSPLMLILSYDEVASPRFLSNKYSMNSVLPQLITILFFSSFFVGTYFSRSTKKMISLNISIKQSKYISYLLFLVGLFSMIYYISAYGGISYVLENMSKIRSGTADIKNYFAAFIKGFTKFINLSFLILFALFLQKQFKSKFEKFIFFIITLACLFSIYLSAGREAGISFIISTLIVYYFVKKEIPLIPGLLLFLFSMFYILFGKIFIFALGNENFDKSKFISESFFQTISNSYNLIIGEFSHQYLSLVNFLQNNYDYRYFGDYIYWLLKPLKLLGIDVPDSISYYNTYIVYGVWDSEIPPGVVAFSFIEGGVFGVVLHGIFLGYFFSWIDRFFNAKKQNSAVILGFYGFIISSFTYLISNADPALFLQNRIPHFIFIFIIFVCFKVYLKNRVD